MHRKISHIVLLILISLKLEAQQNLVPNGDFEYYGSCPTGSSQLSNCTGWSSWTNSTPDYFNTCAHSNSLVSVPVNMGANGYQHALSGNGYAGLFVSIDPANKAYREYITRSIIPMQVDSTYEVSLSINLINNRRWAVDDIGVFFFDNGPASVSTTYYVAVTPQIDFSGNGAFEDTLNWVRLVKTFTADSTYDNVVIGGFRHPSNAQIVTYSGASPLCYYYIDSVKVKRVGKVDINCTDTILCANDTIWVLYRINDTSYFNSNNVFRLQLSNATGSFANPVTIGTKNSQVSDTIIGIIPANVSNGSGYKIRMIANNNQYTSKDNGYNINIGNIDSAAVTVNVSSPICEGDTLSLSASCNVNAATYLWEGPGSYNSTSAVSNIVGSIPSQSGIYYSTMKIYGCSVKDTFSVQIKPKPSKPVAGSNSPICSGDTLALTVASTSGSNYSWTGPASFTSTIQTPFRITTTTAMSGNYIVTAELSGCSRKDTTTVTVKPLPLAINTTSNSPVCSGDSLLLNADTSTTSVTYAWAGPNGFSANTQSSFVVSSTQAATGWYKMTVNLGGCIYQDSTYALVNVTPSGPTAGYNSPLCVGETLQLNTNTVAGGVYAWVGAGNFTSTLQNPIRTNMQFGDTGIYYVSVTVNGCTSAVDSTKVIINPQPFVVILATPGNDICAGDSIRFTALPNNHGGTPVYQWYINSTPVGASGITYNSSTLSNGDVVRCDMTENTKCSRPTTDQSNDIHVTVLPVLSPFVTISANPTPPWNGNQSVTFTATPTNGGTSPTYQWTRNGQNVTGAVNYTWGANANQLSDNDVICVVLHSKYECPDPDTALSNCINTGFTSAADLSNRQTILLYPNPNKGNFKIEIPLSVATSAEEEVGIEITNAMGQVIYRDNAVADNGLLHKEIMLNNPTSGIYLLQLQSAKGRQLLRFVVR